MSLIRISNINKAFKMGEETLNALNNLNLIINEKELVSIVGTSGCGKSTLMNILGLLDLPSSGSYFLDGLDVSHMSDDELSDIRNKKIGFVFQSFNLLPRASALQNVELPLLYNSGHNYTEKDIRELATKALRRVGLENRMHHRPNELSGGQRQRVAIARALVNDPLLILADEPTGALDSKTSIEILDLFNELNQNGVTVLIVTHDQKIADRCNRIIRMSDGKIINDDFAIGSSS